MRAIILVTASLGLLLGGCYEVDKPIITRDIAIEVPGLNGDVLSSNGDTIVFSFDGRSMSYQGGERQTDGSIEWEPCSFLVMSLRNDFYWFQCGPETKGDGQEAHALWLFKFESRVRQLSSPYRPAMTEDEFRQFASQHRVTVSEGKPHLFRSRDDILLFLKAHAHVPLEEIHFKWRFPGREANAGGSGSDRAMPALHLILFA